MESMSRTGSWVNPPVMVEREEAAPFTDLLSSIERMASKLDDLTNRIDALIERDRKP